MLIPLKVGQQYMPETLKAVLNSLNLNANVYNTRMCIYAVTLSTKQPMETDTAAIKWDLTVLLASTQRCHPCF